MSSIILGAAYVGDADRAFEQQCFDDLPQSLRQAINDAPLSFCGFAIQAYTLLCNGARVEQLEGALMNAVRQQCPMWKPLREGCAKPRRHGRG